MASTDSMSPARPVVPARGRTTRVRTSPERIAWTSGGLALVASGLAFALLGALAEAPGLAALGALALALIAVAHVAAIVARKSLAEARAEILPEGSPRPGAGGESSVRQDSTRDAKGAGSAASRSRDRAARALKLTLERPIQLALALALPRRTALYGLGLDTVASESLRIALSEDESASEPGGDCDTFHYRLEVDGLRIGDAWIQGFEVDAKVAFGLFSVRVWVPCHVALTVLPRQFGGLGAAFDPTRAAAEEQADLVHRERRGFGMEIRELRDFVPGDPFKHIAWRASARRGKLIAREFESDLQRSIWLLVDASPSMFWGPTGQAKIDHVLDLAAGLAKLLSGGKDRVGLIVHDHAVRVLVEPGRGPAHLMRVMQALLEVPHLVHEDRTELTTGELVDAVARWLELQERRSFAAPPRARTAPASPDARPSPGPTLNREPAWRAPATGEASWRAPATANGEASWRAVPGVALGDLDPRLSRWDEDALAHACRTLVSERVPRMKQLVPPTSYAMHPTHAALRAFARYHGVPLPLDPTPRPGGQAHGLEAALQAILTSHGTVSSGAHTLIAMSDFHTADDHEALRRVAFIARRHRHQLVFVQPTGERAHVGPRGRLRTPRDHELMQALLEVSELRSQEFLRMAQAVLRPAGAIFVTAQAGDPLARVLQRLRNVA